MGACSPVEAGMKGQKENRKAQKNRCIHLHLYFFVTSTTDCFVSDDIFTKTEWAHCNLEWLSKWKKGKKKLVGGNKSYRSKQK